MSSSRRSFAPLLLFGLAVAACQDPLVSPDDTGPGVVPRPQFAQGDNGTWTVTTLSDPGDGTCDDTECTLREAIEAAASGDNVVFAAGLQGEILLTAGQLEIFRKDLSVDGDGRITVDAQNASRVFMVAAVVGTHEITLAGMTIEDGTLLVDPGAGIWATQGAQLRLENVTVASNSTGADGGGIAVQESSTLTMINSTVKGNTAGQSGGGIANQGSLTVTASTVSGNNATRSGGGIAMGFTGIATIARSTISGNVAAELDGGGISSSGTLNVLSSTIVSNSSTSGGTSGLYGPTGGTNVGNSIIANGLGGSECEGNITSLGHNLVTKTGGCNFFSGGDRRVDAGAVLTQVLEEELKDNGGPTETHALIVRGLAMDAGYCPGESEDQRGLTRPIDDPVMPNALDACDIGAYELQGPFVAMTDLILSQSANKTSVKAGDLLTYTVRVRNLGPETAPNVVVTNVLSSGVTFVSATHATGTHTAPPAGETGTVTWYLGDLLDQGNETTEIQVTVRIKGRTTISNSASVASDAVDPNIANNSATLAVSVAAGGTKPPGKGK